MDAPWYTRSFRRNLIDMHISDFQEKYLAAYDPETYAQNLARSKVDTAILYAGSCLGICYFPTRAGYMHKNLHGRDILGETVAAATPGREEAVQGEADLKALEAFRAKFPALRDADAFTLIES